MLVWVWGSVVWAWASAPVTPAETSFPRSRCAARSCTNRNRNPRVSSIRGRARSRRAAGTHIFNSSCRRKFNNRSSKSSSSISNRNSSNVNSSF
ncbi:hypothetical protein C8J57DRAFT_1349373 [Mycena rebaudengoi]|nr:hypothetical protein C8J57DRAFT_1349373 [Mycena rebaudengoi]